MTKRSAGVLLFRKARDGVEVLLAHPGGPFWRRKDEGSWSIPKGEYDETEDARAAAKRELLEETGIALSAELIPLGTFAQPSGKLVSAWAAEGGFDPRELTSNMCRVEWPPKSGRMLDIPEIDRVEWFPIERATTKITRGQVPIVEALAKRLGVGIAREESSAAKR